MASFYDIMHAIVVHGCYVYLNTCGFSCNTRVHTFFSCASDNKTVLLF